MGCAACGGRYTPTRYKVTFTNGEERVYLSEIEARIAASEAGGGIIERLTG